MVPVPGRQARREHPAERLARGFARLVSLPYAPLLHFVRATRPQHGLKRRERLANLHQALKARNPRLRGNFLVLDDVVTTGATAQECARALKQAGAETVCVLALARG